MAPKELEDEWLQTMMKIFYDLESEEYKKMKHLLTDIPKGIKQNKKRDAMPQIILSHLGFEKSVQVIDDVMKKIPRNDAAVRGLLKPFLDIKKGRKRKVIDGSSCKKSETGRVNKKARNLVRESTCKTGDGTLNPVTITQAKASVVGTILTVQGKVIESKIEKKTVKDEKKKVPMKSITLQDETDSIEVCFWRDQVKNCKTRKGAAFIVSNLRATSFKDKISLHSTGNSKTHKVEMQKKPTKKPADKD